MKSTLRIHRLMGALVAVQLLIWLVTGVMFNVKHRYAEAYELLSAPGPEQPADVLSTSPAEAAQLLGEGNLALVHDARGYGYRKEGDARVVDAASGSLRSPLDEHELRSVVERALAKSKHAHRYGAIDSAVLDDTTWTVELVTGQRLNVDAWTGDIRHTGPLNDFIDWSYRFHYMQYTPWKGLNVAIVLAWVVMTVVLVTTGVRILIARWRGARKPARD